MPEPLDFVPLTVDELQVYFPQYEIITFIAAGGMGAVYLANQNSIDRKVAIKVLPREMSADEAFSAQFRAEAKVMSRMNHPNLVGFFDFGEVDGMLFIIMEFVDGKSLHHSAHGEVIAEEIALELIVGLTEGVDHAHEAGILHRDIKPANILLDPKATPKLGDFGLARPVEESEAGKMIFGTPGYTAPEVVENPEAIDERSDIFSIGAILYELLTGHMPADPYVPPSREQNVSPKFDKVVQRAISPDPNLRYPDTKSLLKDLYKLMAAGIQDEQKAQVLQHEDIMATRVLSPGTQTTAAVTPPIVTSQIGGTQSYEPVVQTQPVVPQPVAHATQPVAYPAEPQVHQPIPQNNGVPQPIPRSAPLATTGSLRGPQTYGTNPGYQQPKPASNLPKLMAILIIGLASLAAAVYFLGVKKKQVADAEKPVDMTVRPVEVVEVEPEEEKEPEIVRIPMDELKDLTSNLRQGDFSELPYGTEKVGDKAYFYYELAQTWHNAQKVAERHGGYVACAETVALKGTFKQYMAKHELSSVWLGGGTTGSGQLSWVTGRDWFFQNFKPKHDGVLALEKNGEFSVLHPDQKKKFFICWDLKGKQQGTYESQLERVRDSIVKGDPWAPPGSLMVDGKIYYVYAKRFLWSEAQRCASAYKAKLFIPTNADSHRYVSALTKMFLHKNDGAWIGGTVSEDGEVNWGGDAPEINEWKAEPSSGGKPQGIRIMNGQPAYWAAFDRYNGAGGAVLEWKYAEPSASLKKKLKPSFLLPNHSG